MIVTRTPYRLSFFGGGTDYPAWYLREGGQVLSTTIDRYSYVSVRWLPPFFAHRHHIVWSHVETVSSIAEILHPAVREGLRMLGFDDTRGVQIHHQGDLPARAGMGSSSAFAVGLIHALEALRGRLVDRHELAQRAIELEQAKLGEAVGSQDQVAAAYGGLNRIEFRRSGEIRVDPVPVAAPRLDELRRHLLLVFTGTSRMGPTVAADVVARMGERRAVLQRLRDMVDEGIQILCSTQDLHGFGELLHEAWARKRELSPQVSSDPVDDAYRRAQRAGAIGGKLLGAGGSGFLALFAPPERHGAIQRALAGRVVVPFAFEDEGSRIVVYSPESESGTERRREVAVRPPLARRAARVGGTVTGLVRSGR